MSEDRLILAGNEDHSRERRSPENFHPPRIPIESIEANAEQINVHEDDAS